ncbi:MAG: hypothetical protein ACOXZ4_03295 [Sphaerochaetaceae bacterium]
MSIGKRLKQWFSGEEKEANPIATETAQERKSMIEGIEELNETIVKRSWFPALM